MLKESLTRVGAKVRFKIDKAQDVRWQGSLYSQRTAEAQQGKASKNKTKENADNQNKLTENYLVCVCGCVWGCKDSSDKDKKEYGPKA